MPEVYQQFLEAMLIDFLYLLYQTRMILLISKKVFLRGGFLETPTYGKSK